VKLKASTEFALIAFVVIGVLWYTAINMILNNQGASNG
jgi:hypothetical protein